MAKNQEIMNFLTDNLTLDFMDLADKNESDSSLTAFVLANFIDLMINGLNKSQLEEFRKKREDYNKRQEEIALRLDPIKYSAHISSILVPLLKELNDKKEENIVTYKDYCKFYEEKIKPTVAEFPKEIQSRMEPDNIFEYFSYRINTNIAWCDSWENYNNISLAIYSIIESGYLDFNMHISEFRCYKTASDC